jgi:protein-S-isoprenylcysteine O-methyltransferase Ste14
MFVVAGLDHRLRWSDVPSAISIVADVFVVVSFYFIFLTFRENTFAASTVTVEKNQTVVRTGPYAIVRHPMYAAALFLFAAGPPALGSWWTLIVSALILVLLVARLLHEEQYLTAHLSGYADYRRDVRNRLIPYVW